MKTMGLSDLRLVNPKQFPDPEAETRATGAVDVLQAAKVTDSLGAALHGSILAVALSARLRDLGPAASTPREFMPGLLAAAAQGEVALVFGNETSGLTNEELLHCQATVNIPSNPQFSSLNLGAAVQVLCYECRVAAYAGLANQVGQGVTPFASPPATHEEIEGLYAHLEAVMTQTGFLNPVQPGRLLPKLRRLFGRAALERDEINILRGILSATQAPTRHGRQE